MSENLYKSDLSWTISATVYILPSKDLIIPLWKLEYVPFVLGHKIGGCEAAQTTPTPSVLGRIAHYHTEVPLLAIPKWIRLIPNKSLTSNTVQFWSICHPYVTVTHLTKITFHQPGWCVTTAKFHQTRPNNNHMWVGVTSHPSVRQPNFISSEGPVMHDWSIEIVQ
jgi:hypothetical protein